MFQTREPRNEAERLAWLALRERGHLVSRRGWPDFAVLRPDGTFYAVEVKPKDTTPIKWSQQMAMDQMISRGIDCFRFDPVNGFVQLSGEDVKEGTQMALDEMGMRPPSQNKPLHDLSPRDLAKVTRFAASV